MYAMAPSRSSRSAARIPGRKRPFELRAALFVAPFGFVVANLIVYWSGWETVWRIMVALAIGFVAFVAYRALGDRDRMPQLDVRPALWLVPYLGGLSLISYLGRYDGRNVIPFWWDIALVAVFSLVMFWLAYASRLPAERAQRYVENLDPMLDEADANEPLNAPSRQQP